ncbi:hypothetical protein VTN00DRAFT_95 [Thermoascus crustaceus]|uniref:uncharacterized protein n=1 Tax=Thermoascus crustaceus TaxID=5088 RepID=UPI00374285CD
MICLSTLAPNGSKKAPNDLSPLQRPGVRPHAVLSKVGKYCKNGILHRTLVGKGSTPWAPLTGGENQASLE